jgi:hypothetical protein
LGVTTVTSNWRVNDSECTVVPLAGTETVKLPQTFDQNGAGDTLPSRDLAG